MKTSKLLSYIDPSFKEKFLIDPSIPVLNLPDYIRTSDERNDFDWLMVTLHGAFVRNICEDLNIELCEFTPQAVREEFPKMNFAMVLVTCTGNRIDRRYLRLAKTGGAPI